MKAVDDSKAKGAPPKAQDAVSKPKVGGSKARGGASPADGVNNRRFNRFNWSTQVQILWFDEHARGTSVAMRTADLSDGGIALLSRSWIHQDRCGAVLLVDPKGEPVIRWIRVLHGRYESERKAHLIGCMWIPTPENAPPVRILALPTGVQLEFDTDLSAKAI